MFITSICDVRGHWRDRKRNQRKKKKEELMREEREKDKQGRRGRRTEEKKATEPRVNEKSLEFTCNWGLVNPQDPRPSSRRFGGLQRLEAPASAGQMVKDVEASYSEPKWGNLHTPPHATPPAFLDPKLKRRNLKKARRLFALKRPPDPNRTGLWALKGRFCCLPHLSLGCRDNRGRESFATGV